MNISRFFFLALFACWLASSFSAQAQTGSSISLNVYRDANSSGGRDADDAGVPGVKVTLKKVGGDEEEYDAEADEEGNVFFNDVPPGEYVMVITYEDGISIATNQFLVEPNGGNYVFAIPAPDSTSVPTFAVLQAMNPASTKGPDVSPFGP